MKSFFKGYGKSFAIVFLSQSSEKKERRINMFAINSESSSLSLIAFLSSFAIKELNDLDHLYDLSVDFDSFESFDSIENTLQDLTNTYDSLSQSQKRRQAYFQCIESIWQSLDQYQAQIVFSFLKENFSHFFEKSDHAIDDCLESLNNLESISFLPSMFDFYDLSKEIINNRVDDALDRVNDSITLTNKVMEYELTQLDLCQLENIMNCHEDPSTDHLDKETKEYLVKSKVFQRKMTLKKKSEKYDYSKGYAIFIAAKKLKINSQDIQRYNRFGIGLLSPISKISDMIKELPINMQENIDDALSGNRYALRALRQVFKE